MDLRKAVLKEHSKKQALKIVDYVGNNATRFKALIEVFIEGPYRVTQRSAWPLSLIVEAHPKLIEPHLTTVLNFIKKPGIHDSAKRNVVRLLQFIVIPKRFHGKVIELCFDFLQSKAEPVAIKVFSMTVLEQVTRGIPELRRELQIILEDQLTYGSAGYKSRAMKVLKDLKKVD